MKKSMIAAAAAIALLCACGQSPAQDQYEEHIPAQTEIPAESVLSAEETTTVKYSSRYMNMSIELPDGWGYEIIQSGISEEEPDLTMELEPFGIRFWPEESPEAEFKLFYNPDGIGLCGTGITSESVSFDSGLSALKNTETYQSGEKWVLYIFDNVPGTYSLEYMLPSNMAEEYEPKLDKILESVKLGTEVMGERRATDLAAGELDGEYENVIGQFDFILGVWEIRFYDADYTQLESLYVNQDGNISKTPGG